MRLRNSLGSESSTFSTTLTKCSRFIFHPLKEMLCLFSMVRPLAFWGKTGEENVFQRSPAAGCPGLQPVFLAPQKTLRNTEDLGRTKKDQFSSAEGWREVGCVAQHDKRIYRGAIPFAWYIREAGAAHPLATVFF